MRSDRAEAKPMGRECARQWRSGHMVIEGEFHPGGGAGREGARRGTEWGAGLGAASRFPDRG